MKFLFTGRPKGSALPRRQHPASLTGYARLDHTFGRSLGVSRILRDVLGTGFPGLPREPSIESRARKASDFALVANMQVRAAVWLQ